jgi:hypothetical protein
MTIKQTTCEIDFDSVEAAPGGISLYRSMPDGGREFVRSVSPVDAVSALSDGAYDYHSPVGMRLVAALWEGVKAGCFTLTDSEFTSLWRWVVATLFVNDLAHRNGVVEAPGATGALVLSPVFVGDDGTALNIFVAGVRLALTVHLEDIAHQQCPGDAWVIIQRTYKEMVTAETGVLALSAFGDELLSRMHNGFLRSLQKDGIPEELVRH